MGNPKSLRDLIPNYQLMPQPIILPTFTNPQPTKEQLAQREVAKKTLLSFISTQRCQVCEAQLDGLVSHGEARVYCAANKEEYSVYFLPGKQHPEWFNASYIFDNREYEFLAHHLADGEYQYTVNLLDRDFVPKYRRENRKQLASFSALSPLFPAGIDEDFLLKKIKLWAFYA